MRPVGRAAGETAVGLATAPGRVHVADASDAPGEPAPGRRASRRAAAGDRRVAVRSRRSIRCEPPAPRSVLVAVVVLASLPRGVRRRELGADPVHGRQRASTRRLGRRRPRARRTGHERSPGGAPAPADGVGAAGRRREDHPDRHDRPRGHATSRSRCATARDGIRALGGYVGASQHLERPDDQPIATITYRIPADRWEDALDLLRGLNGQTTKVVSEQTQAVEVTGQVIDIAGTDPEPPSQRDRAPGDRPQRARKVSDVLEVQAQLTACAARSSS